MIELNIFLSEISLSLAVSILALFLLKGALREVLADLCRGTQRALFWTRFTQLMLIIGPLLGTLLFTPIDGCTDTFNVTTFRETLRHALIGGFITLCGVAMVIWKSIPNNNSAFPAAETPSAPIESGN